jgi:hypothetical protein
MTPEERQRYLAQRLTWIKRRARRYVRSFNISRRLAIFDASMDFTLFIGASA